MISRADGVYDTPPIAPEMWQALHIAGEYAVIAITAALNFRELTGVGDVIDLSIHEAVSTCTEVAMPTYIYNGAVVQRQTGTPRRGNPNAPVAASHQGWPLR